MSRRCDVSEKARAWLCAFATPGLTYALRGPRAVDRVAERERCHSDWVMDLDIVARYEARQLLENDELR